MKVIIDVGASDGVYCNKWAMNKNYNVYAFEPNPKSFNKISISTNLKKYQLAVSDNEGETNFYEANYTNSSSILPFTVNTKKWKNPTPSAPELKTINTFKVNCIRLDNFLKENNISEIDFIKIDTQGHDLAVIKSLGDFIYNVKELVCEVQIVDYELYKNSSKKDDLMNYMKEKDFTVWKKQNWSQNQELNIWFTNNKYKDFLHLS
jgi:FkbM family methyltransferase